jgi:hypothetical protein
VKSKAISALVIAQVFLMSSNVWADEAPDNRPRISDVGGDVRSPGVTLVIVLALLMIGFGIGLTVGRRTRREVK